MADSQSDRWSDRKKVLIVDPVRSAAVFSDLSAVRYPFSLPSIPHSHHHIHLHAAGDFYFDFVVEALAQERAAEWGVHADVARGCIEFVRANDAIDHFIAVVILERRPGSKKYTIGIGRWLIDHHHAVESLSQKAHAAVYFAQLSLAVDVLRVFGTVSLRGRLLHRLRHLRSEHSPEVIQFVLKSFRSLGCDEFRTFGLGWSVAHVEDVIRFANGD
jgi:hypothetical protein